jgi:hypothetical protein
MRPFWCVLLLGCGGAKPAPEPPKQTVVIDNEPVATKPVDPAREPAIEQARTAGILGVTKAEFDNQPDTPTVSLAPVPGPRDKASIRATVRTSLKAIQFCYEKRLLADPTLAGTTTVSFDIMPDGTVSASTGSGFDPEIDACVAKSVGALRFPADAGIMHVNYPFAFKSST